MLSPINDEARPGGHRDGLNIVKSAKAKFHALNSSPHRQ